MKTRFVEKNLREILASLGAENAQNEARIILAWLFSCSLNEIFLHEEITVEQAQKAEVLAQKRSTGYPLQYLLGEQEFMGLPFKVTPAVLIPRGDTEPMTEEIIRILKTMPAPKVADICCGSGAIGIAIASLVPNSVVVAVDIDEKALLIAEENAEGLSNIYFAQGDLCAPLQNSSVLIDAANESSMQEAICQDAAIIMNKAAVKSQNQISFTAITNAEKQPPSEKRSDIAPLAANESSMQEAICQDAAIEAGVKNKAVDIIVMDGGEKTVQRELFDLIVCNPPYVSAKEMKELATEVCFEPPLALFGGEDGLDFYRRLVQEAPQYLKKDALLVLEIGCEQSNAVCDLLNAAGFTIQKIMNDWGSRPRSIFAQWR